MIIIMQRTLEHVTKVGNTHGMQAEEIQSIIRIWSDVSSDNMRVTNDGIKYVKLEL